MKKLVFLVSGGGGNLKFIHRSILLNFVENFCTVGIIADRHCGTIEFGRDNDILSFQIFYMRSQPLALRRLLEVLASDLIITNIHKILDPETIGLYHGKMINLHYSLLPSFKGVIGVKPIEEAVKMGCEFVGTTTHFVETEVDSGRIISQSIVPVIEGTAFKYLVNQVFRIGCLNLLSAIQLVNQESTALGFQTNQLIYDDSIKFCFNPPFLIKFGGGNLPKIFGNLFSKFNSKKYDKIIIYGSGPFAKLINFYFSESNLYQIVAFTVDKAFLKEDSFCGKPIIVFERIEVEYPPAYYKMFVAIGYKSMRNRKLMFDQAKAKGYQLVNYISPQAIVHNDLQLGENNVIMANVHIEPFSIVGDNNIVWSDTLLCHDLILGNHNYFAPKCVISGNVTVKDLCFFGSGVTLIDHLTIASETYLRAGAMLFQNTQPFTQYAGNPAYAIGKTHEQTGIIIQR